MAEQVQKGRMIGGPGWTSSHISEFFGGDCWYGIPCGATEKDSDPLGRIVHDYGYYRTNSYSINAAHSNTSVKYDSIRKRVRLLANIIWYIKADLKNGFRQFGTHPADWRCQVYCNGPDEHYIDLACPFGKTNSTLEFCSPLKSFAISVAARFAERREVVPPLLSSYVDDIYGGVPHNRSYDLALEFRSYICSMGEKHTFAFNKKPHKTPLPSRQQVILGCLFDSTNRRMRSSDSKVAKYVGRINELLMVGRASVKNIMSLHGNLVFAANVAPFGRPFLAALSALVIGRKLGEIVALGRLARLCLRI